MKLDVTLSESNQTFDPLFDESNRHFTSGFCELQIIKADCYEGKYEVTPRVNSQTLATAQKIMKENLIVKAIPYYDVSNSAGGNTIFIGNEV